MSKKLLFYIIFFVVLIVGFYLVMTQLIPDLAKKKKYVIGSVAEFAFINQDGERITHQNVKDRVYVAEYFFTTCKGICPRMNDQMKRVYDQYKSEPDFLILAHTSDPATDNPAQLKKFSDSLGVDTRKWIFLTGRKDSLYNMARHSYKIDDPANNLQDLDSDFLHTQFFALVDRKRKVRKIYDGLKQSEVDQMIKDIDKMLNSE